MKIFLTLTLPLIILLSSCGNNTNLVKDGNVYLFQGKEKIIISFRSATDIKLLANTGRAISFLQKNLPLSKNDDSVLIEGLTTDEFFNFFMIADQLLLQTEYYNNKTIIYSYIASLFQTFYYSYIPFIPLSEFQNFTKDKSINQKESSILLKSSVDYAVKDIFFVSILEFFERPQRYFYPQKTQEELFKVLIYPEIITFWEYMQFRFGKNKVLEYAKTPYNETTWKTTFGESLNETEASFVKTLDNIHQSSNILKDEVKYTTFTNSLQLYMSGTKQSLMRE